MSAVTGNLAGGVKPDGPLPWPPQQARPSGLFLAPPGYHRPFAADRLLEVIGARRAAELEMVRAELASQDGGRWAILFLPFLDYTDSPWRSSWAGTWIAVRHATETVRADSPLTLRALISPAQWRWHDHAAA